jgi:hypothetical protein
VQGEWDSEEGEMRERKKQGRKERHNKKEKK